MAESKEQILFLESKVKSLEERIRNYQLTDSKNSVPVAIPPKKETKSQKPENTKSVESDNSPVDPPPLPPKSASIKKNSARIKPPSDQVNR